MNFNQKITHLGASFARHRESYLSGALLLSFAVGLSLSIVSVLELCTSACSETKAYLFFGLPFGYIGIAFFSAATLLLAYSKRYPVVQYLLIAMFVGALGSEAVLIAIQKYQIGSWCPVCLSIAAAIALAGLILCVNFLISHYKEGHPMMMLKYLLTTSPIFFAGVIVAMLGISKPDHRLAAMNSMKEKIELGNTKSAIEVYFVSDWFCPACQRAEPVVIDAAPAIMQQAGLFFVDFAVHPESENYTPYNLDFLANNKTRYFQIRALLSRLTKTNKSPDDTAIRQAIAPIGEELKELGYGDIKAGLSFFEEVATKYGIRSTPTMIIANTKTGKTVKLQGSEEIQEKAILNAIQSVRE